MNGTPLNAFSNSRMIVALPFLTLVSISLVPVTAVQASVLLMDIDEILFQGNEPAGTILDAMVRMDIVEDTGMWFLKLELTNATDGDNSATAAHVLSGVGFSFPSGISINSDKSFNAISINLIDGTTPSTKIDTGAVDPDIANDNWGFGDASGGHFSSPAVFSYDTVISTFNSDVTGTTLIGTAADGSASGNIDQFDYALKSSLAGPGPGAKEPYYEDHLTFSVKLSVPDVFNSDLAMDALNDINAGPVAVAFGSPLFSSEEEETPGAPEPFSHVVWALLTMMTLGISCRSQR